ncbi:MAG: aminoglycoside phosphotransferase family protein [Actinomycetota bacterium]|nr:aminoglycoside phosphotransferase family protein [Actinomycetota bacterium]
MLTPDEIAARTARAVSAATTAAAELGLRVADARVLYEAFSVVVHLAPAPVVARVPTVLPPSYTKSPDTQTAQQRAELAVTGRLAAHGHPVIPPSPLVPAEPVRRDGFSMTFWQFVEQVPDAEPDMPKRIEETARLHAALRDYDGEELGFWAPFGMYIPDGLCALQGRDDLLPPTDLARAQREWALIAPVLTSRAAFETAFPDIGLQAIHGDAPYHNMITTPGGELWSDFELVTVGAVESDLALVGPDGIATYDVAAAALGLRPLDHRVLRVTELAARLAVVAALAMAPDLPMLTTAVAPMIELWRRSPELREL